MNKSKSGQLKSLNHKKKLLPIADNLRSKLWNVYSKVWNVYSELGNGHPKASNEDFVKVP